ncbi:MAG: hypothetical protein ACJ73E_13830, partial [Mycobacteriales bacterium]
MAADPRTDSTAGSSDRTRDVAEHLVTRGRHQGYLHPNDIARAFAAAGLPASHGRRVLRTLSDSGVTVMLDSPSAPPARGSRSTAARTAAASASTRSTVTRSTDRAAKPAGKPVAEPARPRVAAVPEPAPAAAPAKRSRRKA